MASASTGNPCAPAKPMESSKAMHGLDGQLIGYAKFPPLKGFSENLMNVVRQIYPGQQTEMMPFLLAGFLGYPSYPGLSEKENVTIFFYGDKGNAVPVILLQLNKDSQIRTMLPQMGWVVEDHEMNSTVWTLLARSKQDIALVGDATSFKKLVDLNREKGEYQAELRLFTDYIKLSEQTVKQAVRNQGQASESHPGDKSTMRLVDLALDELENMKWMSVGMDLGKETVTVGFAGEAKQDTPEGALLSAKVGGPVPVAKYIQSNETFAFAGKYDPQAFLTYYKVLSDKVKKHVNEQGKKTFEAMDAMMVDIMPSAEGTFAGVANLQDNGSWDARTINGGKWTNKQLAAAGDTYYNTVMPSLAAHFITIRDLPMTYQYNFEPKNFVFDGIPVHKATSTYTFTVESPAVPLAPGEPAPKPEVINKEVVEYLAVDQGNYLYANDSDGMKTLITAVNDGKAVDNNVGSFYKPQAGKLLDYRVNMVKFARQASGGEDLATRNPKLAKGLEDLESQNLAPVTGEVEAGDREIKAFARIPMETLNKLAVLVQQSRAQEIVEIDVLTMEEVDVVPASQAGSQQGEPSQQQPTSGSPAQQTAQ